MRDWALVYQPQPIQRDALMLAVALALHLPLLTLHMGTPRKGKERLSRLVNIDYIEQKAAERKQVKDNAAQESARKAAAKAEEDARRAAEMREKLLKKATPLPPVVPKAEVKKDLAAPVDPGKIQTMLKQQMEQKTLPQLKSDKNFMEKPGQLPGAAGAKEIKMGGGGVKAIQMGAKPGAVGGPGAGPALKGKGGFSVSEKSVPMSIGGGDEGLKMGGGPAIVVPVGSRGKVDSNVLSSVARVQDKGALKGKAGGVGGGPGVGNSSGLALGPGGAGGAIAGTGASRGPALPLPAMPALSSNKSFSEKATSSGGSATGPMRASGAALPDVSALQRRTARPARPLFQITGPLANRPVVSRVIPEYPEWAKAKGVEATVTLQFTVTPDGAVRTTILVIRTSGYPQLDQTAVDALKQWRFSPLPTDQVRDEVGAITFSFSVR